MAILAAVTHFASVIWAESLVAVDALSPVLTGFALGLALASAPGPVQAVLMEEAVRGGVPRGLRAMAGANLTFGVILLSVALGLSVTAPSPGALRVLNIAGGALLLWLALKGVRSRPVLEQRVDSRRGLPPAGRGVLAVLLNPGTWVFLGTAASSLLAEATRRGGTSTAVVVALTLLTGLGVGDGAVVMLGGVAVRRAGEQIARWVRRSLATVLAGLGVWLLVRGLIG
jgi:threonine/homoserine/homoserine lactone efflux protein